MSANDSNSNTTSSQTIVDLRSVLFQTLADLRDKTNPMEIARARAIADVADKVIDSARVEIEFLEATNADTGTGFISAQPALPEGFKVSKVHRLKG